MQFHVTSDYAIRTALHLTMHPDRTCTAEEIQRQMGVPANHLNKVTARLKEAGILAAVKGNGGGYLPGAAVYGAITAKMKTSLEQTTIGGLLEK